MKTYEYRILLYLDILGFKKIIDDTVNSDEKIEWLYEALELIKKEVSEIKEDRTAVITQFSDLIIVSFRVDDTDKIIPLFQCIVSLNIQLVNKGILCRGVITYGPLFHNKDFIFGPALIDAYLTEKSATIYPRVILDKSVLDVIDKNYLGESKQLPIKYRLYVKWPLKKDTDEKFYFDYFTHALFQFESKVERKVYLRKLRALIIKMKEDNKKNEPSIQIKYGWMKNKFNSFLKELPNNKVFAQNEIISIQDRITKIE